uniref:Trypsin inhibitor 3 n=1 Tax=Momordica charantia TaxID=3673 RepID=ITR3_MOMCH|nr:RecName: Full=Trypsin inhibitor 3; AltName: Full=MCTI-III; AltName: Full=Trypsin inhibitor III [Momordica charantia]AAB33859.1 MCTI-III=serine protease inhibitor [Momordica charantia=balsam pears, Peptide Partial, 30 aa] [Momordica charantia]AAB34878.1 trypsin inhibitor III, MCTI-III=serine proteinase inhibitor [Momordica charantia=bitter gourds, LINN, Peptide, 30 aa] [Momordica charantia]prf//2105265A trypsin inhibitor MCTI-III [Momordica charantia]
ERGCPRILKQCKQDSDCPGECICMAHGFCG